MKKLGWLVLLFLPLSVFAEPGEDGASDECLRSMRDLYKFYYYEIQPNPKNEACKQNEPLSSTETLQMQVVIGEMKKHCGPDIIAKINENLKDDALKNETAVS